MITKKILPVIAGLVVAFLTMGIIEYANSFFFPFPEGFDPMDIEALRAFTLTLPMAAFLVVLGGWALGSLLGGMTVTCIARRDLERARTLTVVTGVLLTLAGILNNLYFLPGVQPLWFTIVGTPFFLIFSYLGYVWMKRRIASGRPATLS